MVRRDYGISPTLELQNRPPRPRNRAVEYAKRRRSALKWAFWSVYGAEIPKMAKWRCVCGFAVSRDARHTYIYNSLGKAGQVCAFSRVTKLVFDQEQIPSAHYLFSRTAREGCTPPMNRKIVSVKGNLVEMLTVRQVGGILINSMY